MTAASRPSTTRRRRLATLFTGAFLALTWSACTKDTEPRSATTASSAVEAPAPTDTPQPTAEPLAGAAKAVAGADEAAAQGKVVGGDESYTLTLDAPESVASGAEGTVRVTVLPKKGWKMNKEFPTKLEVQAPADVQVTKAEQRVADAERFDEGAAVFAVAFKPTAAGSKAFQAKFKFAVCTDATCDPKKHELAWAVDVK